MNLDTPSFLEKYNLPLKAINLIIVLLSWGWVLETSTIQPTINIDIEPLLTFIGSIIPLGWLEISQASRMSKVDADKKLMKLFLEQVPSDSKALYFMEFCHMGDSFEAEILSDLYTISTEWKYPERMFHDPDLEQKRAEFVNLISSFWEVASKNTWPHAAKFQRVPSEWMYEKPQEWHRVVNDLQHLSTEAVKTRKELIRIAKERLHI